MQVLDAYIQFPSSKLHQLHILIYLLAYNAPWAGYKQLIAIWYNIMAPIDPAVYGEDMVMDARVAPLAVLPGSCWSDFKGLPPAVGVCVLDFGKALAFVRRVVAPVARLPRCGSSVPQLAPGPVWVGRTMGVGPGCWVKPIQFDSIQSLVYMQHNNPFNSLLEHLHAPHINIGCRLYFGTLHIAEHSPHLPASCAPYCQGLGYKQSFSISQTS